MIVVAVVRNVAEAAMSVQTAARKAINPATTTGKHATVTLAAPVRDPLAVTAPASIDASATKQPLRTTKRGTTAARGATHKHHETGSGVQAIQVTNLITLVALGPVEVAAVETFSSAMTGDIIIPERSYRNRKPRSKRRNSRTHRLDKTSVTKNGIAIGNKIPIELTVKTIIGTSEQQSSSDYHARARARICAITSIYIPWR